MDIDLPVRDPVIQFTMLTAIVLAVQLTLERTKKLSPLVGLLVMGMLIGPGGGNFLLREPVAQLLGQIGLIYIMFLAAVEIDLRIVWDHPQETGIFGLLAFGLSLCPAVAVALLLGYSWPPALLFGALLSSHTLLAYPIVLGLGLIKRQSVVIAVGGTIVTDTLALLLLAAVMAVVSDGGSWGAALPVGLLTVLVMASFWGVPRLSRYVFQQPRFTEAEKSLYVLVVVLLLAATAELMGTKDILGAFLAGLCLNRPLWHREELRKHIEFVGRMLFIPFFYVSTGMLLEMEVLGRGGVWLVAGLMLALVVAGKTAASWATGAMYNFPRRDRLLMTTLTIPQAAATLAVTVTAQQAGLFGEEEVDAVIILIFATCLLGALGTNYIGQQIAHRSTAAD